MHIISALEKYLRVILFTCVLVQSTAGLLCFLCEGDDCEEGGGFQVECPKESSVCVRYVDVTGRALKKGPNAVYRRQCGASWQGIEGCRQATVNFDICFCSTDMCNGEEGAPILLPTTKPPPTTTGDPDAEVTSPPDGGGGDGGPDPPDGNQPTTVKPGGGKVTSTAKPGGKVTTTVKPGGKVTTTTTDEGFAPAGPDQDQVDSNTI